jgi:hypothetical protein
VGDNCVYSLTDGERGSYAVIEDNELKIKRQRAVYYLSRAASSNAVDHLTSLAP